MVTNTTATMELVESGEKRDRVGRRITLVARRDELVGAWQRSGLTQAEFARREGMRYPTFASWVLSARRTGRRSQRGRRCVLPKCNLPASVGALGLEVRLADGEEYDGARRRLVGNTTPGWPVGALAARGRRRLRVAIIPPARGTQPIARRQLSRSGTVGQLRSLRELCAYARRRRMARVLGARAPSLP